MIYTGIPNFQFLHDVCADVENSQTVGSTLYNVVRGRGLTIYILLLREARIKSTRGVNIIKW